MLSFILLKVFVKAIGATVREAAAGNAQDCRDLEDIHNNNED